MALTKEQQATRLTGIGGSEAAIVCGLSPWKTPVQLWQEKTGRVQPENLDDKEIVRWGVLLEDVICDEYARRQGVKVRRLNDTRVHKDHDFMLAHIDRDIVGIPEGLEAKNASQWTIDKWGESDTDDVPLFYLTQGVHYMAVFDYEAWRFSVLLGGNELRHYRITRDLESEGRLIELERAFMHCVKTDTPPPPIRIEDLVLLYPKTHGTIRATEEIATLVAECARLAEERKAIVKRETEIKLIVGEFMGAAGDLLDPTDPSVTIATYRSHDENRIDSKRLRAEHPAIAELVEKTSPVRKFLVK
jgi:putative phage-type endonuclease